MIFGTGGLIGNFIFGYLQDNWGRKPSYFVFLLVQIVGGLLGAVSWDFESWLFFRLIVGLTVPAILNGPYVLAIELVEPTKRPLVTLILNIAYSLGLVLLAIVVIIFRHWREISLVTSGPFFLIYMLYRYIPESPRWLLAVGKYDRAQAVLERIAKANRKNLTVVWSGIFSDYRKAANSSATPIVDKKSYGILSLIKSPRLRRRTTLITLLWIANTSVYVGLSYCAPALGGNEITNFFLSGLVELPTYIILWPSLHYFGRRWILCISMVSGGLACLTTYCFQNGCG